MTTIEICIDVDLGEYVFKRHFREPPEAVKVVWTRKPNGPASRICERDYITSNGCRVRHRYHGEGIGVFSTGYCPYF